MNLKAQFEDTKEQREYYDGLLAKSLGEEEAYQNSILGKYSKQVTSISKHISSIPYKDKNELDQGLPQNKGDHLQQGERVWKVERMRV